MLQRYLADAAGRLVDDAQKRQVGARIEQQTQVGEDVLVLLALEEGQDAADREWQALLDGGLFQATWERVHADKNGVIAIVPAALLDGIADQLRDAFRLVAAVVEREDRDRLAVGIVGDEILFLAVAVLRDQMARRPQDRLG